jgi:hypothetical protein
MREWGSARSQLLPARTGQGAVGEMAIFQSQQQQCVDEHEESCGGAHGGIAAELWLPETQQSFFVAKVEFDLRASQVGLQDLLRR